jgi:hypothetical protein
VAEELDMTQREWGWYCRDVMEQAADRETEKRVIIVTESTK